MIHGIVLSLSMSPWFKMSLALDGLINLHLVSLRSVF